MAERHVSVKILRLLLSALVFYLCSGCSENIAGNTSTTTNGISGAAVSSDGYAAVEAEVYLSRVISEGVPNRLVEQGKTDDKGGFSFTGLDSGSYVIEIRTGDSLEGIIVRDIEIVQPDSKTFVHVELEETVSLRKTGTIHLPLIRKGFQGDVCAAFMNVFRSRCTETDTLTFMKVSRGKRVLGLSWSLPPDGQRIAALPPFTFDQQESLVLPEIDVTAAGLFGDSLVITLDVSGISRQGPVMNYPLFIRLSGSETGQARFFTAQDHGSIGFQFFDYNGSRLLFQSERIDTDLGKAEIWLQIPGISVDRDVYEFTLAYDAAENAFHDAGPVFDSSAGFEAAWTMSPDGEDLGPHSLGTEWSGSVSDVEGVLGPAIRLESVFAQGDLHGNENFLLSPEALTFEAWILPEVNTFYIFHMDNGIFQIAQNSRYLFSTTDAGLLSVGYRDSLNNLVRIMSSPASAPVLGEWSHVAGVLEPANDHIALYVNGRQIKSVSGAGFSSPAFDPVIANSFTIGGEDDGTKLATGIMDNIFISNTARSTDWVRLNYEIQKPGSGRVTIGK